jgi:L-iditol 2-dehydrogenase
VLRLAGCGRIIAVDLDPDRLALARRLGATAAVPADAPDLVDQIKQIADGRGVDAVFEVVGTANAVNTALAIARKGASVTLVGNLASRIDIPLQAVVTRQLTLIGSCASAGEYPTCLDLLARGRIDVAAIISETPPLADGARWFERLYAREKGLLKVLLKP